jgi:hypothetical protein
MKKKLDTDAEQIRRLSNVASKHMKNEQNSTANNKQTNK